MDAVAKEAEIAKGTVYLYFESKEDIIASLTVRARQELLRKFQNSTLDIESPIEQVRSIIMANFEFNLEYSLYQDLIAFYEGNSNYEETEDLMYASQAIHAFLVSILEAARRQKQIRPDIDIQEFSLMVWGMSVGMTQLINTKEQILRMYLQGSNLDFYSHFADLIIQGIASK